MTGLAADEAAATGEGEGSHSFLTGGEPMKGAEGVNEGGEGRADSRSGYSSGYGWARVRSGGVERVGEAEIEWRRR